MLLYLGLDNKDLYEGCEIKEIAGRLTLVTPIDQAVNLVGRNINKIIADQQYRTEIVLTGPMAVWSYLVVFHNVVHKFSKVFYDDGRSGPVLIAQH